MFNAIESSCHRHTAFIFAYIYWKCNGHKVHTCLHCKYSNHFPFLFIFKWLHNEYVSSAYNSSKIRRSKWLPCIKEYSHRNIVHKVNLLLIPRMRMFCNIAIVLLMYSVDMTQYYYLIETFWRNLSTWKWFVLSFPRN